MVVNYSFHDMIDEKTKDDNLFAGMARLFFGNQCADYELEITGTIEYEYDFE